MRKPAKTAKTIQAVLVGQVEARLNELRPARSGSMREFLWALDLLEWLHGKCTMSADRVLGKAAFVGLDWGDEVFE